MYSCNTCSDGSVIPERFYPKEVQDKFRFEYKYGLRSDLRAPDTKNFWLCSGLLIYKARSKHVSGLFNMYHGMVWFIQGSCKQEIKCSQVLYSLVLPQWWLRGASLYWGVWTVHWWLPPAETWLGHFHQTPVSVSSQQLPQHQPETAISLCSLSQTDENQDAPLSWRNTPKEVETAVDCKGVVCKTTHYRPDDDWSIQSKRWQSYSPNSSW